jgi:hypothetical protein
MFWNSEDNNAYYVSKPHETLMGNWDTRNGIIKGEGLVHLKFLDKEKVRIGRTDYITNGFYLKDYIGEVFEKSSRPNLPSGISFSISHKLKDYLFNEVIHG